MTDEVITKDQAKKIAKSYLCANCWGMLYADYDPNTKLASVECVNPNCDHKAGFVSKYYVERERALNDSQYQAVLFYCRDILGMPRIPQEEIKKAMDALFPD